MKVNWEKIWDVAEVTVFGGLAAYGIGWAGLQIAAAFAEVAQIESVPEILIEEPDEQPRVLLGGFIID